MTTLTETAGEDGMIRLWKLPDGQPLCPPLSASPAALDVSFSPAGDLLAAGFADGTACIWNVADAYDLRHVLQHGTGRVRRIRFSPDGGMLATASDVDDHLRLWDVPSGQPRYRPLFQQGSVHDVDFSPDGSLLALGNGSKQFAAWRLGTRIQRHAMPPHQYTVRFVRFIDKQRFLTVSMDRFTRLWSTTSTEPLTTSPRLKSVISQIAIHRPASLAAIGTRDGQVTLWNYETNDVVELEKVHRSHVDAISFSLDGSMLVTGSRDGTARVWGLSARRPIGPWMRHQHQISDAEFATDGRMAFTAARDGTVRFWDVGFRGPAVELGEASGSGMVRFGPEGKRLGTLFANKLDIFDVDDDGALLARCIHEWDDIADFAFDPAGHVIATATSTHTVRFWNAQSGESIGLPVFHRDWVRSVACALRARPTQCSQVPVGHAKLRQHQEKIMRLLPSASISAQRSREPVEFLQPSAIRLRASGGDRCAFRKDRPTEPNVVKSTDEGSGVALPTSELNRIRKESRNRSPTVA